MAESRTTWPIFVSLGVTGLGVLVGLLAWLFPVAGGAEPEARRSGGAAGSGTREGEAARTGTPTVPASTTSMPADSPPARSPSAESPSAASLPPALSGRTPEGWAGTWRGSTSSGEELIIVKLRAGSEGQPVGTIEWPVSSCRGELTLLAVMEEKLVVHEVITRDPEERCREEAQIDFVLVGDALLLGGAEWGKNATLQRV
ncbi:hypothetical protein ABT117_14710 [Streptomyces sp. NPDC002262]|uniref:hypothetical protein n=1 Tax=Streptomyces sp. NPDC002262 TaxID=3154414 RepID=UPI003329081E